MTDDYCGRNRVPLEREKNFNTPKGARNLRFIRISGTHAERPWQDVENGGVYPRN